GPAGVASRSADNRAVFNHPIYPIHIRRNRTMARKIRTEADARATPRPTPAQGFTFAVARGQKRSLERGTATNHKKNPGKRPKSGG
ncbi:MAG: hypothetical protein JSR49_15845, partial [Proteobacteria bacterium]|nr:hypothetical protein [Pseudomonadota bacterium]